MEVGLHWIDEHLLSNYLSACKEEVKECSKGQEYLLIDLPIAVVKKDGKFDHIIIPNLQQTLDILNNVDEEDDQIRLDKVTK